MNVEHDSLLVHPLGTFARRRITVLLGAALRAQQEHIYLWREVRQALLLHAGPAPQSASIFGGCAGAEAAIEVAMKSLAVAMFDEHERSRAEVQARRIGLEWREVFAAATMQEGKA